MRKAILISAVAALLTIAAPAQADPPLPVLSPSRPSTVSWALKWRRVAERQYLQVNDLRGSLGLHRHHEGFAQPSIVSPFWWQAGRGWKHEAKRWAVERHRLERRLRGSGVERWRPLVAKYWPAPLVSKALWVMSRESGGNPLARSRTGAAGLFQLYPAPAGWSDPAINVRLAYQKYRSAGGWSPWRWCGA